MPRKVFPAYAGMIRANEMLTAKSSSRVPRLRGDDPFPVTVGCDIGTRYVFPAYAGMIRLIRKSL